MSHGLPPIEHRLFEEARDLVHALIEVSAEFLIVGAQALAAHRGDGRIDVGPEDTLELLIRPSLDNAMSVMRALAVLDFDQRGITHYDLAHEGTVFELGALGHIYLVTSISGIGFDDAWQSRVSFDIDQRAVGVLGRAALQKHLLASGRAPLDDAEPDPTVATDLN